MSGNSHAATSCDEVRKIRMNQKNDPPAPTTAAGGRETAKSLPAGGKAALEYAARRPDSHPINERNVMLSEMLAV
jgi:hypothetical protein